MIVDFHYRLEENLEALLFHHANLKTNGVVVGFWAKEPAPLRIHLDVSRYMDIVDTRGLNILRDLRANGCRMLHKS